MKTHCGFWLVAAVLMASAMGCATVPTQSLEPERAALATASSAPDEAPSTEALASQLPPAANVASVAAGSLRERVRSSSVERGKALFESHMCGSCHGSVETFQQALSDDEGLEHGLAMLARGGDASPKRLSKRASMPSFKTQLGDQGMLDVLAYLSRG